MSRYCGKCDFRDTLEIFFKDDFNEFMKKTGGVIHIYKGEDKQDIRIESPADLIPYYAHIIAIHGHDPDGDYIVLGEENEIEKNIKSFLSYDLDVTHLLEERHALEKLYAQEKAKPFGEQRII